MVTPNTILFLFIYLFIPSNIRHLIPRSTLLIILVIISDDWQSNRLLPSQCIGPILVVLQKSAFPDALLMDSNKEIMQKSQSFMTSATGLGMEEKTAAKSEPTIL